MTIIVDGVKAKTQTASKDIECDGCALVIRSGKSYKRVLRRDAEGEHIEKYHHVCFLDEFTNEIWKYCQETVIRDGQPSTCSRPIRRTGYKCDRPGDHAKG